MSSESIDLFKYGQLVANVEILEKKIDKLEQSVCQLVELANKSKGGFWGGDGYCLSYKFLHRVLDALYSDQVV